jgi:hypothetical protein
MNRTLIAVALAAGLSLALPDGAEAKSSTSSSTYHSHSSGSHGRHSSSASHNDKGDIHYIRKTCKTAACKKKHPSGTYMIPIKPKKH